MIALLDTHVLLRWVQGGALPEAQRKVLAAASAEQPLLLSDISSWEIAMLVQYGRLSLTLPLRDWLDRATAPPLIRTCSITTAVAVEVTRLPAGFPRDPADRIIAATARVHGATLLTLDRAIIRSRAATTIP